MNRQGQFSYSMKSTREIIIPVTFDPIGVRIPKKLKKKTKKTKTKTTTTTKNIRAAVPQLTSNSCLWISESPEINISNS